MRGLLCERSWVWHPIVTSYPCFDSFAFTYRVYKTDSLRFLSQMMTNRTTDVKSLWYLYLSFVNCRFEILILQLQKQQEELFRKRAAGHHWIKKKEKIRRSFGGKFVLFNTVQGFFNFVRTIDTKLNTNQGLSISLFNWHFSFPKSGCFVSVRILFQWSFMSSFRVRLPPHAISIAIVFLQLTWKSKRRSKTGKKN